MSKTNQHYMTEQERYKLEAYLRAGKSVTWIAAQLDCSRQTIYNELARGGDAKAGSPGYSAAMGQQAQVDRSRNKGCPPKLNQDAPLLAYLEKKMLGIQEDGTTDERKRYSPAAALAAARADGLDVNISVATLYNYIDQGVFQQLRNSDLWEKLRRKPRKKRKTPKRVHKDLPSIEERPKEIEKRDELGHWEMDLVVGPIGSRPCLLTLTERTTRQEIIIKLPDKRARSVRKAFNRLERKTPDFRNKFKSITTDNGSEFLEYDKLKKSVKGKGDRFKIYYCHSFSAWEKGSNENHNRMIRRWFPKGTDFTKVKVKEIKLCQEWMNNYPRKFWTGKLPSKKRQRGAPRG